MYDRLRAMYLDGRLNDAGLNMAVAKNWITAAQADQIRADKLAKELSEETLLQSLDQDAPEPAPTTEVTPTPAPTGDATDADPVDVGSSPS